MEELINILMVDDEPKNLTVLETVLNDPSYRLVRAETAEQALLSLIAEEFALLILDIQMPIMTGLELAKLVKARKKSASVPIIFLTAFYNEDQHILEGYGTGAVDYLFKPVNAAILRSKVAVFAELHRKSREIERMNQALNIEVAERRLAEDQLRKVVEELEVFSYSLAHDLRAPLRSLRSYAEILLTEHAAELQDAARGFLQRIFSSGKRMDELVKDILGYSQVGRGDLPLQPIDLGKLIPDIIATYPSLQPAAADIKICGPLPQVVANESALTQVISNLLGNAVKFVAPNTRPQVTIRAEPTNGLIRLWFEDNGIGIPKTAQPRLFNLFTRLNRPDDYEGTGIGLAIVRKATTRMGGNVGLESEPGQGSRFWVELKKGSTEVPEPIRRPLA